MDDKMPIGAEARALLMEEYFGVLSTISVDVPGYPFGSVVPYCLDRQSRPAILISRIAQHYKNLIADPRASLIVLERAGDDVQVNGRLTCVANVVKVPQQDIDETAERYYRYFPESTDYHKVHDFEFFCFWPVRFRYIGGFGRIHWIEPEKLLKLNPFSAEAERRMIAHMNADHVEAMCRYCRSANAVPTSDTQPQMAGVDAEGFHLRLGRRVLRFPFDAPVTTPAEVRQALVAMAHLGRR
jgi:heme iron utilization protein